jgi:hypothetical protein
VLNVVEPAGEHLPAKVRWLRVVAIAIALIGTTGLTRAL